jgi:hypothetical protein
MTINSCPCSCHELSTINFCSVCVKNHGDVVDPKTYPTIKIGSFQLLEEKYLVLEIKYKKLLEFTKELIKDSEDEENFDPDISIIIKGEKYTKSQYHCAYTNLFGKELLKELGEME